MAKENLILPPRCVADLPDDLEQPHLVSEVKLDGSRYMLYLGKGVDPYERQKLNALLSRQVSKVDNKHVDKTANIPHITALHYPGLEGTVLDGECFLNDFATTMSIMGSGPAVAVEKQEQSGWLTYRAFDIPTYRGKDIRGLPLSERRKVLEHVVKQMNAEGADDVQVIEQWTDDHERHFQEVVSAGGEGLIIKDLRAGYGVSWSKKKKSYEVSCFISGFKPGKGKYAAGVGAIAVSVYDEEGNAIEVGFASGFSDVIRAKMTAEPKAYMHKVVDLYAHELSKDLRLRHPTYFRFRDDLDETDCTMMKLRADLSKGVKSKRWRGE